jgi:ketosteroid isomerase-like protein
MEEQNANPAAVIDRLMRATNDHDIDRLVDCFDERFVNETPAHPARGFEGSEQVRKNWTQIFGAVPDVHSEVVRMVVEGDSVWIELETSGTRRDGAVLLLRGMIIFTVANGVIQSARFYLEPVDEVTGDVNAAVERTLGTAAISSASNP